MRNPDETRNRLLAATMKLIRERGVEATRLDDVCAEANLTKGALFHYFPNKTALVEASASYFATYAETLFASAPYQSEADPLKRFLGYLEFREQILQGTPPEFTCLLGTIVQETHGSCPVLRQVCQAGIWGHAETLVPMIEEAMAAHPPAEPIHAQDLALHTQGVLQGAFVLAKASGSPETAAACVRHLRRYVRMLFGVNAPDPSRS